VSSAEPPAALKIAGANFVAGCLVKIGGMARAPRSVTPNLLEIELHPGDVASPGDVPIRVCNTPNDWDGFNTVNLKVT
jgi:hypothetical protein